MKANELIEVEKSIEKKVKRRKAKKKTAMKVSGAGVKVLAKIIKTRKV